VLFTSSKDAVARVAILDLETGEQKILIDRGQRPLYASTGHILFVRGATLMAVPFDAAERVLTGEPVAILDLGPTNGAPDFALSATGTLAYVSADEEDNWRGALVWVDRTGTVVERAVGESLDKPNDPRLSRDGTRVVVMISALREGRLWVYDLRGRPPIPLAIEGAGGAAVWSPDSQEIAFTNFSPGFPIYTVPWNGSGPSQRLPSAAGVPQEWASGGLLVSNQGIYATPIAGGEPRDVIAGDDREFDAALSPDGRWLAYVSDRAGQFDVWVKDYLDAAAAPIPVSRSGGYEPRWSADGEELFYLQGGSMYAVEVEIEAAELSFLPPVTLFSGSFFGAPSPETRSYDVFDGRFLMIQREDTVGANDAPANIVIVENWFEELKRLVPTQ
jgi:serine/threonine-protein kinase